MEDNFVDKIGSMFRYRSPSFRNDEIRLLLKLVDEHKSIILNKSTANSITYSKDIVWKRIMKSFNNQTKHIPRTNDVLRTKWENLKRNARKTSLVEDGGDGYKNEILKSVLAICAFENACSGDQYASDREFVAVKESNTDEESYVNEKEDNKHWECDNNYRCSEDSLDDERTADNEKEVNIGNVPFSPIECRLLLHCVKTEKMTLFIKTPTSKKHEAWRRITEAYNKKSPTKRKIKELIMKFHAIKTMAKKVNMKRLFPRKINRYEKINNTDICQMNLNNGSNVTELKVEPMSDLSDIDFEVEDRREQNVAESNHITNGLHSTNDPLSNTNNSDAAQLSTILIPNIQGTSNSTDIQQIIEMKKELLRYKLETAKLERKRVEQALEAERGERAQRQLEAALRVRAARLQLAAAAARLPRAHPALAYTNEEHLQEYLSSYTADDT